MKNGLVLFVFLAGIALPGLAQDEHKRAMELFKSRQYKEAIVLLEESIASHPDWYFPIMLKGYCNQKLKKYDEALRNFNDSLTLEPPTSEIPKIKHAMANTYKIQKKYDKAIQAFTDLIKLSGEEKHFDLYFNRGQCEMQIAKGDRSKAQSYFSKAVVSFSEALKKPTNRKDLQIEASFQKAFAQYKIGNLKGGISSLEKSIQAFQDVIRRNEKEKRAHTFIVNLQFQIVEKSKGAGKTAAYNKAVSYIERYLKSWPDDVDMINKKGLALQGAKRYKDAIAVFQAVAAKRPNDGEVLFSIGSCQMADKQFATAINTFKKAMDKGLTQDPRVYSFTAHCHQKQKQGCDGPDIPRQKAAVDVLNLGIKTVTSPQAKQALQGELKRASNNLEILTSNVATDKDNHTTTLTNISEVQKTIRGNLRLLEKNKEKHLQQATEELAAAIKLGEEAISNDRKTLVEEFKTLTKYIKAAEKCGGQKYYPRFNEMKQVYAARDK
ncbi:MAG: tetratricopeptide repeat protein [Acidobacteriota bacterium]|nr:tetratricopeptide repeat protein [Acidobacteriota bacterium]